MPDLIFFFLFYKQIVGFLFIVLQQPSPEMKLYASLCVCFSWEWKPWQWRTCCRPRRRYRLTIGSWRSRRSSWRGTWPYWETTACCWWDLRALLLSLSILVLFISPLLVQKKDLLHFFFKRLQRTLNLDVGPTTLRFTSNHFYGTREAWHLRKCTLPLPGGSNSSLTRVSVFITRLSMIVDGWKVCLQSAALCAWKLLNSAGSLSESLGSSTTMPKRFSY